MSIRATNFVRGLRGLTPSEKLVAFVLADFANKDESKGSFPKMRLVAEACGFEHRQTASDNVQRLAEKKIILGKQSRGKMPTRWRFIGQNRPPKEKGSPWSPASPLFSTSNWLRGSDLN